MIIGTVISIILIILLISILMLQIKNGIQREQRLVISSLITLMIGLFSLIATRFRPTLLDVLAIYGVWFTITFAVVVFDILSNFRVSRPKLELIREEEKSDYILIEPITNPPGPKLINSQLIDISNTGAVKIQKYEINLRVPNEFQIPISKLTNKMLFIELIKPDRMEFLLLTLAFLTNWLVMSPITGLGPFHPFMLIYSGIIAFIFYTTRWSYTGPFQFAARMKLIEKKLMEGQHVVDFKIIGFIWSFILILTGVILTPNSI